MDANQSPGEVCAIMDVQSGKVQLYFVGVCTYATGCIIWGASFLHAGCTVVINMTVNVCL